MGQCLSKCCGEGGEESHVLPAVNDQPATPVAPQSPARSPSRSPPGSPPRSAPIPIPPRSRARDAGLLLTPTTGHAGNRRDRAQHMRAGLRPSTGGGARQGGELLAREDNSYSSSFADDELRGRRARSREPVYLPLPPARPPSPPPCPAEATEAEFDDTTMASIVPGEVIASSTPRRRTRAVDAESVSKSSSKGSERSRKSVRSTKTAKTTKSASASIRSRGPSPPAAGHGMLATAWFYDANSETVEDRAARLAEQEETRRVNREKERARKEQKLQKKASDRALRDAKKEAKAAEGGPALGADFAAAWESLRGNLPFGKTKRAASESK